MKQFFLTVASVFVGLLLFVVGVPFLLIVMAAGAAGPPVPHTVLHPVGPARRPVGPGASEPLRRVRRRRVR